MNETHRALTQLEIRPQGLRGVAPVLINSCTEMQETTGRKPTPNGVTNTAHPEHGRIKYRSITDRWDLDHFHKATDYKQRENKERRVDKGDAIIPTHDTSNEEQKEQSLGVKKGSSTQKNLDTAQTYAQIIDSSSRSQLIRETFHAREKPFSNVTGQG